MDWFCLVQQLVFIYIFHDLKDILFLFLQIFMIWSFFHMSFIQPKFFFIFYYCFYNISLIRFSTYTKHIYLMYSKEVLGFFIYFFILLYSLNTLFTEKDLPWLLYESIKVLEIKISEVFNLFLATLFYNTSSTFSW